METRIAGDTPDSAEKKKKNRLRRAGSLEKTLTPFPERKSVRWRVKEKERWGRVMGEGVSDFHCSLPPLYRGIDGAGASRSPVK